LLVRNDLDRDVRYDVALGYDLYGESFARHGEWRADSSRAVKWCPDGGFVPFRTDGHWARDGKHLRWVSNANDWRDVTTHSGHWTLAEATDEWCWVPGVIKHEAPVVWRAGNGWVGWATKPTTREHLPARAWTYTRMRALHESPIHPLEDDDEAAAR